MLPKAERLTKKDWTGLKPKVIFRGNFLDIATSPSTKNLFTCVVSKKRVKKATDRNKIKRKIYNIIKTEKPKGKNFIIIYPKQSVMSSSSKNIKLEIIKAFDTI